MKLILEIEDTFMIRGRGLVVVGAVIKDSPTYRSGDEVVVVKPDGLEHKTRINGVEMFHTHTCTPQHVPQNVGILLKTLTKEEVQKGDKLYKV